MPQRRPASCRGEATRDAAWRGSLRIFPEAAGAGSPPEWLAEGLSGAVSYTHLTLPTKA